MEQKEKKPTLGLAPNFCSIQTSLGTKKILDGAKVNLSLGMAPNSKLGLNLVFFLFAPFELLLVCHHKKKLGWSKKNSKLGSVPNSKSCPSSIFFFLLHLSFFRVKKNLDGAGKKPSWGLVPNLELNPSLAFCFLLHPSFSQH
jgi:hypothetical protein